MLNRNGALDVDTGGFTVDDLGELRKRRLDRLIAALHEHEERAERLSGGPGDHDVDLHARVRAIIVPRPGGRR